MGKSFKIILILFIGGLGLPSVLYVLPPSSSIKKWCGPKGGYGGVMRQHHTCFQCTFSNHCRVKRFMS